MLLAPPDPFRLTAEVTALASTFSKPRMVDVPDVAWLMAEERSRLTADFRIRVSVVPVPPSSVPPVPL